jgi:hypothetical protein
MVFLSYVCYTWKTNSTNDFRNGPLNISESSRAQPGGTKNGMRTWSPDIMVVHGYIRGEKDKLDTQIIAAWRAGVVLMVANSWGCEAKALWLHASFDMVASIFLSLLPWVLIGQCFSDAFEN